VGWGFHFFLCNQQSPRFVYFREGGAV
jgi:hypothetical protein